MAKLPSSRNHLSAFTCIESVVFRGTGKDGDPVRMVREYWRLPTSNTWDRAEFLFEMDEWQIEQDKQHENAESNRSVDQASTSPGAGA